MLNKVKARKGYSVPVSFTTTVCPFPGLSRSHKSCGLAYGEFQQSTPIFPVYESMGSPRLLGSPVASLTYCRLPDYTVPFDVRYRGWERVRQAGREY